MMTLRFDVTTFVITLIVLYIIMIIGHVYGNIGYGDLNILVKWIKRPLTFSSKTNVSKPKNTLQPYYAT
jgi:hypothetical protein